MTLRVPINHRPGELKMRNSEYQRNYFRQRYATDPEFRAHRLELSSRYISERYATDPVFRTRCLRSSRNSRLKKEHGITLDQFEAQLAAQHSACACCGNKLGRIRRVHHKRDGAIGLLCGACCKRVASLRHVREHAERFEAYFKKWGMTAELGLLHELMQSWGLKPAPSEAGGT
jgi:hypothetical protein